MKRKRKDIMNKMERSEKDYGGGSGVTVFQSDRFRVVHWDCGRNGNKTVIEFNRQDPWRFDRLEIKFDGLLAFESDEDCFSQFTCKEILREFDEVYKLGVIRGGEDKLRDVRKFLGLRR